MVEILEHSDLLEIPSGVICHQVNCIGAMGAGLALQIRKKWSIVYENTKVIASHSSHVLTNFLGMYLT